MYRFWSLLFYSVPVLGTACIVWAWLELPPFRRHWLPENINLMGEPIDHLFYVILVLSGVVFLGTGLALGLFLWKYADRPGCKPVRCVHGSKKAELIWSVIPGIVLLALSLYQIRPWVNVSIDRPTIEVDGEIVPKPPEFKVIGRQFNWDFQYPGPDGLLDTEDDVILTDTVCAVPVDQEIVLQIEAKDVLHSFFVPKLRVKQDVVPGMVQYVWFHAVQTGECEIACTELCGWGHYKMKAKLLVLPEDEYQQWVEARFREVHEVPRPDSP